MYGLVYGLVSVYGEATLLMKNLLNRTLGIRPFRPEVMTIQDF
jgi:hypothetical protein